MTRTAVIGCGFGDEGKGLVTEYLCSKYSKPLVVRYSGGQQAGHTVMKDGIRHVFANFGSGTLSGASTYWASTATIDPIGIINEFETLKNKAINPILFIDGKCPVTTPYEVRHNQNTEELNQHGSCGVGVGQTWEREECFYSLQAEDLLYPSVMNIKLKIIREWYGKYVYENRFRECVQELNKLTDNIQIIHKMPDFYDDIIFESSQGLLLDQNIGFFPHVTRSNVGIRNLSDKIEEIYIVTRAYQTRHGNGPMTNEDLHHNIKEDPNETNVDHPYQGKFRRTLLDLDLLQYAMIKDGCVRSRFPLSLVITCLDHVENDWRFTHKGKVIFSHSEDVFIDKIANILDVSEVLVSHSPYSENIKKWKIS